MNIPPKYKVGDKVVILDLLQEGTIEKDDFSLVIGWSYDIRLNLGFSICRPEADLRLSISISVSSPVSFPGTIQVPSNLIPSHQAYLDNLNQLAGTDEPTPLISSIIKKCTCGVHKTYGLECDAHSNWCDLYGK